MFAVKFMPVAVEDLSEIAEYIAQDNLKRAISFITEIELKTRELLATAPLAGRIYKGKTRFFPIGRYIVLYEVNQRKKLVEVLHVVAGAKDWKKA